MNIPKYQPDIRSVQRVNNLKNRRNSHGSTESNRRISRALGYETMVSEPRADFHCVGDK